MRGREVAVPREHPRRVHARAHVVERRALRQALAAEAAVAALRAMGLPAAAIGQLTTESSPPTLTLAFD